MDRETATVLRWMKHEPEAWALAQRLVEAADNPVPILESYFGSASIRATGLVADLIDDAMARVDWSVVADAIRKD